MRTRAAGGMRTSVIWAAPQPQRSCKAAWEKMVSATEAVGGYGAETRRGEAGRGGGPARPRAVPVRSRWRKQAGERPRKLVGDEWRLQGAQGTRRSEAAERRGGEEAGDTP